jgi:hypothetical protein
MNMEVADQVKNWNAPPCPMIKQLLPKKRILHRRIVSALKAHQRLDTKEKET